MEDIYWYWWVVSLVFLILAILALPFLLVLSAATAIIGVIVYFIPDLSWPVKLILLGLFSAAVIPLQQYYRKVKPILTDNPHLNRRSDRHLGRVLTLERPIVGGIGRQSINGISWRIMGPDLAAGKKVKVIGVDGASLLVEEIDSSD